MKRKSGRKSAKKSEENPNGVEDKSEQNGDTSESNLLEEDEAPKHKKRKSGKSKKKTAAATPKKEEPSTGGESEVESEDEEPLEENIAKDKKTPKGKKGVKKYAEDPLADVGEENSDDEIEEKKPAKKGKKAAKKNDDEEAVDEDDESQYEVEQVLDDKMVKGVRHYLIRWKGYEEESDTWEPENTLECAELIQAYKDKNKKSKGKKSLKKENKDEEWDENEDFEVDRILEVHHKRDGKREFLVSWKGYGSIDNSWEPEEHMNCKDLIIKFMEKVDKAKMLDDRELRVKRKQAQRFTLSTREIGRRLSKRFRDKERVQYHDAE